MGKQSPAAECQPALPKAAHCQVNSELEFRITEQSEVVCVLKERRIHLTTATVTAVTATERIFGFFNGSSFTLEVLF